MYMQMLDLTDEQKQMRQLARDFTDKEIIPFISRDREREWTAPASERMPWELLKKADRLGLRGLGVPEKYGGIKLEDQAQTFAILAEELAWLDAASQPAAPKPAAPRSVGFPEAPKRPDPLDRRITLTAGGAPLNLLLSRLADQAGLRDRGRIARGKKADLVVFDAAVLHVIDDRIDAQVGRRDDACDAERADELQRVVQNRHADNGTEERKPVGEDPQLTVPDVRPDDAGHARQRVGEAHPLVVDAIRGLGGDLDDRARIHAALEVARAAEREDPPVVHDRHPVAELVGLLHVVGGEQHGLPGRVEVPEDLPQRQPALRVEAGGGLVEEQHVGTVEQGPCDREPLAHPLRVAADAVAAPGLESDPLEQRVEVHVPSAEQPGEEGQVLAAGHAFVKILVFGNNSDQWLESSLFGDDVAAGDSSIPGSGL